MNSTKYKLQKITYLTRDWTQISCLAVKHLNHYTRMFSVLVGGCNWIQFMHGWFCPICLIHLIGWNVLHFGKNRFNQSTNSKILKFSECSEFNKNIRIQYSRFVFTIIVCVCTMKKSRKCGVAKDRVNWQLFALEIRLQLLTWLAQVGLESI